jgi:hypothetical protein
MKSCLRDRSLLLVHYGEGRAAHLAHLEACSDCAARYRQLVRDLELIGHALERMPAVITVPRRSRAPRSRWVPVAAVLAAGVVVAGVEMWLWPDTLVMVRGQRNTDEADTLRFLAEVSAVLPAPSDGETLVLPSAPHLTDPDLEEGDDDSLGELGEAWTRSGASEDDTWGGYGNENT